MDSPRWYTVRCPELYSVNVNTSASTNTTEKQCQSQLAGYDSWYQKSHRYGLKLFPLINVGDGEIQDSFAPIRLCAFKHTLPLRMEVKASCGTAGEGACGI